MSARVQAWLDRYLGGVQWRPLWISALSAAAMIVYWYHSADPPPWFLELAPTLTGVSAPKLHKVLWSHLTSVVVLMSVPLVTCWAVEGWKPTELGLRVRGSGREFGLVVGLWLAFLPVIAWVSGFDAFQKQYPGVPAAAHNPRIFWMHELFYLSKWMSWEFFFRGFMLFGLRKDLGGTAILLSTVPFAIMHCGKPELETLAAILAGLILCGIALSSRSVWPGVLLHWLVAGSMDFFASDWWR